ncbi:ClpP-like prohead protease/major capsid protein fusion protein [Enterobacter ludwigii]
MDQKTAVLLPVMAGAPGQMMSDQWYEVRAAAADSPGEILIYEQIGGWGISASSFIREVSDAGLFNASLVDIRIHSPGGSTLDGFAIFNTLKRLSGQVNIYIDGLAASMASVIAMLPGATVHIPSNAFVMIHNPWGGVMGEADDMRDYADLLDKNSKNMVDAYAAKTGLPREEIEALMKNETWMTGAEAVEKGFADILLPEMTMEACLNEKTAKEFSNMPQAAKSFFGPRGTATQSPQPDKPAQTQAVQQPAQQPQTVDIAAMAVQMQQQMQANEMTRRTAVGEVFSAFANHPGVSELQAACVADQFCDAAAAQQKLLAKLAENIEPAAGGYVHVYAGSGNWVGDAVRNVLMAQAGHEKIEVENQFNGMSLMELARASLSHRGIGVAGKDRMGIVGAAFTHSTSDFAYILMDVANKSALVGWENAPETFSLWTRAGRLTDFRPSHRVGMDAFPTLRRVREGAEYKYATVGDTGAKIMLATYGELFSISRQAIINDDLSVISTIPQAMGLAARATVGDLVYAVLTDNEEFNGDKLFSSARGNLISGALGVDTLSDARSQMKRQKTDNGRHLNISPAFLLVPTVQETLADQLLHSIGVPGAENNSNIKNPIQNMATIIAEPRLDTHSEDAWYLTAAKGRDTIEVAYLDGNDAPVVESTSGFTVDGVTMKVRIDAGVAPMDYRGLLKSTGL